ncbi:MAG: MmgE/PrpD family protein [Nitrososphaerota archaeon]
MIEHIVKKIDEYNPPIDVTRILSENIARTEYGDIPLSAVSSAKVFLLNAIGQMAAGATARSSRIVMNYIRAIGGRPEATCIHYGHRTNIYNAALANGSFSFGNELPDPSGPLSLVSPVAPAALAICERELANGHELITAIALGIEVTLRLASAAPEIPVKRPLNPTSTFGPFGAAVAAGKILRMGSEAIENVLTCCPAQAAGTMQGFITKAESSKLVPGFAASYGLRAATMASRGISGARQMLEGKAGFYMCIAGLDAEGAPRFYLDRVVERFGQRWLIAETAPNGLEEARRTCGMLLAQAGYSVEQGSAVSDIVSNIEDEDDVTRLLSNLLIGGG